MNPRLSWSILIGFVVTVCAMSAQTTQPVAKPFVYWTSSTPYGGPAAEAGLIGVTTAPPPSQIKRAAGYSNLWQARNDAAYNGQANIERLKRDTCIAASVAVHTSTVEPYRGRLLLDAANPAVATWIKHEAQRLVSGGWSIVFLDNCDLGIGEEWVPTAGRPGSEWAQKNMAAAIATFRAEWAALAPGRPLTLVMNLSKYWKPWTSDPFAYLKSIGVNAIMLESLNTRKAGSPTDGVYVAGMDLAKRVLAAGGEVWLLHKSKGNAAADQAAKEIDAELGPLGIVYTASE